MKPDYASENKIWFHIQGNIAFPNDKSYYAKREGNLHNDDESHKHYGSGGIWIRLWFEDGFGNDWHRKAIK